MSDLRLFKQAIIWGVGAQTGAYLVVGATKSTATVLEKVSKKLHKTADKLEVVANKKEKP